MHYILKTRGYSSRQDAANIVSSDNQPIKTLGSAIEKIMELLEYQQEEIAEVMICNDLGKTVYSVKPTGNRSFHVTELF